MCNVRQMIVSCDCSRLVKKTSAEGPAEHFQIIPSDWNRVRGRSQSTLTIFILAFFDHLPPCVDIFYGMDVEKNEHFMTTYLPRLVNVVCEWPLK